MIGLYKVSSIVSFIGAGAFIFTAFEEGKLVLIAMAFVMLCNGMNFWMKCNESGSEIDKEAGNAKK